MDIGVDHLGPYVHAEFGDGENAKAVSEKRQGNYGEGQRGPLPGRTKEEMAGQQTG
jgi:hypothetical protein